MRGRRERGVSFMGVLILLGIAAGIYWIVVFGGVHWENHEFKAVLRQAGNMAYTEPSDQRLREFIFRRADEMFGYDVEEFGQRQRRLKIDFQPDDLIIERSKIPALVKIKVSYTRVVQLPIIGGERALYFPLEIEQDLSPVKY